MVLIIGRAGILPTIFLLDILQTRRYICNYTLDLTNNKYLILNYSNPVLPQGLEPQFLTPKVSVLPIRRKENLLVDLLCLI